MPSLFSGREQNEWYPRTVELTYWHVENNPAFRNYVDLVYNRPNVPRLFLLPKFRCVDENSLLPFESIRRHSEDRSLQGNSRLLVLMLRLSNGYCAIPD